MRVLNPSAQPSRNFKSAPLLVTATPRSVFFSATPDLVWSPCRIGRAIAFVLFVWLASSPVRADVFGSGSNSFEISFVDVGYAGNPAGSPAASPPGVGSVGYLYRIAMFEASERMLSVANDLGQLNISHSSRGSDKPATYVSWNEAARFINWLNTSRGYPPAYKFSSQPGSPTYDPNADAQAWHPSDEGYDPLNPWRNTGAAYFLPSESEWFKAAYYNPVATNYFNYPTGSDEPPLPIAGGTNANTAVYFQQASPANVFEAGGTSPLGTVGQGGNVWEVMETPYGPTSPLKVARGGSFENYYYGTPEFDLASTNRWVGELPTYESFNFGFRVAAKPAEVIDPVDTDGDGLTDAWERGFGRYQIISGGYTWDQAKADAESRGGHLATITSQAEQDLILSIVPSGSGGPLIWLGGSDQASEGLWRWVTNEVWGYTAWFPGRPDNTGNQDYLLVADENHAYWDDFYGTALASYLLEFGYPTDPLDPDSDDDGFNDKVESDAGSDPNNASSVPGFADTDGDSVNNFRESVDGTDPNDASSFNALSKNLAAYYPFDANAKDQSGYGNDGSIVGGVALTADRFGNTNKAFVFDGVDGYVDVGQPVGTNPENLTQAAWVKIISRQTRPGYPVDTLITQRQADDGSDWPSLCILTSGKPTLYLDEAGYQNLATAPQSVPLESWAYVCGVKRGQTYEIYVNGLLRAQFTDARATGGSPHNMQFMRHGAWGSTFAHGALDEVRIYNRALTAGEINQLYQSQVGNLDSDGDGIADSSETNTGTLVSATDTGTDPYDADTDGDGFDDNIEVAAGSDPNSAASVPGPVDSDGDGVNDYRENADGTDPNDPNSFNPLSKGLAAYYPFDGSANDESGYANHGTAYESQSSADRFGLPSKAWRFNASSHSSNSRVVIPKAEQHNFQNELTVSLWARFNEPWSYKVEHLIWNRPAYQNYGWGMAFNQDDSAYGSQKYNGGGFGVVTSGGGLEIVNNSTAWSFGQMSHWRHYLAVFGGGRLKLYVDGVLVGDRAISGQILNGPADLIIGGCDNSPYANNRDVDAVRVYERALSATEVEHLYLSEVPVVYVDGSATGAGDGSSWQDAYTDLQSALVAAQPGWQIWVAKGTYKPSSTGDRNASFALKSAVALYGGFAGTETSPQQRDIPSNPTILSGDLLGNDNATLAYSEPTRSENSFHVIEALNVTSAAVLDGFIVKGGHANQGLSGADSVGSCLYIEGSNLTIRNCEFRDTFGVKGPSIYDMGGGNISIESCTFKGNKAFSVGSVHLASDFLIKDSAFVGNSASDSPYGYQWGGALFVVDVTGSVVNSVFADNYAAEDGGAVYSHGNTTFVNCTFSGNESATTGTAVMDREKEAVFQNCIFWGNSGGQGLVGLPGAGLVIASANPYGGPASIGLGGPAKNSIVQGGYAAPGSVNIVAGDPAFYSPTNPLGVDGVLGTSDDGLQVMGWSPALEAGDNSFVPADITTDIAGAPRIVGTVDLGAYEGAKILDPAGDEDGDGILNGAETNSGVYTSTSDTGTNPLKPDTDGDGLTDGVETNTGSFVTASNTGTNPLAADTNADGITDGEAVTWNFNPLLDQTPFLEFLRFAVGQSGGRFGVFTQGQHDANRTNGQADVTGSPADYNLFTQAQYDANRATGRLDVTSNPMSYGLYTADSIMDLRMGGLMIQRQGTNAVISFQPQTTTDLALPFTNNGTPITHQIPMPGNKGFIRIRANP